MITIKDFAYGVPASVRPGSVVRVTNSDQVAHTVTADQGSAFDAAVDPGGSATFKAPNKPGRYKFHCTYHSNMHGTLVVR
ncbi:MAG: cupredoxin domain-containing protein [Jatrophihabitans sp.]|uniref:cupredoxin domain-containing protein n=1 Tax=Jatrophihabitans sp. TaxID=1932789 RepID=UPI003F803555